MPISQPDKKDLQALYNEYGQTHGGKKGDYFSNNPLKLTAGSGFAVSLRPRWSATA